MGWFSSLCSTVSSFISSGVSKVKDLVSSAASNVVSWIKNIFSLNEAPSYDPKTATVDETKKINELIGKCVDNYSGEAEEYEIVVKKIVRTRFQKIKTLLEEVNEINEEDEPIIDDNIFNIFRLKSKEIIKSLDNFYTKQIVNVFSLNNNELIDILKKEKGIGKKNDLTNLAKKTLKKANDELLKALAENVKEQQEFIETKLENYLKDRVNLLETSKKETEKIIQMSEKDKEERLKLQANYNHIIDKLEILKDLMEA
ncbi:hypothetical protein [Fusobacterium animalis]|uniref:hypothetical protein n=1 Tax=Fusobacterium animalis TaxID=76859 RepID=UPI0034DED25E